MAHLLKTGRIKVGFPGDFGPWGNPFFEDRGLAPSHDDTGGIMKHPYLGGYSDKELTSLILQYGDYPAAKAVVQRELRRRQQNRKGPWDIDPMWTPS